MSRPVNLKLLKLGDGSSSEFNFNKIESFLGENGPILNTLRTTVAQAPGGFTSDVDGELVVFGASIINTGSSFASAFGIGVSGLNHTSTGVLAVTLTETFPTSTSFGVTLPLYAVGATPIGSTATTVRAASCTATTITFNILNSSGTLVDAHFFFVGLGTLAT